MRRTPKAIRNAIRRYSDANDIDLSEVLITSREMNFAVLAQLARRGAGLPVGWLVMQYILRERLYWKMKRGGSV